MVYVVVLNWKGAADTKACIDSILKMSQLQTNYCLVVCDNDSPDNSFELIKHHVLVRSQVNCCDVHVLSEQDIVNGYEPTGAINSVYLIKNNHNGGYAAGNNVGIQLALRDPKCDYIWLLNNDTIVDSMALDSLYAKCSKRNELGVCGSRLVYYHHPKFIQGLGGTINRWIATTKHLCAYADANGLFDDDSVESKIDYVIGASMFIKAELVKKIGFLCEDYFLYFEEIDYCLRARKAGFILGVCTNSIVFHKEGASINGSVSNGLVSDFSDYFFWSSKLIFVRKFHSLFFFMSTFLYMVIVKVIKAEFKRLYNLLFVPRKRFLE